MPRNLQVTLLLFIFLLAPQLAGNGLHLQDCWNTLEIVSVDLPGLVLWSSGLVDAQVTIASAGSILVFRSFKNFHIAQSWSNNNLIFHCFRNYTMNQIPKEESTLSCTYSQGCLIIK